MIAEQNSTIQSSTPGENVLNGTIAGLPTDKPITKPKRPLDIVLRANTRNMEIDYIGLMNQILRRQQISMQQLQRYMSTLQIARDRAIRRINDENTAMANRISRSNKLSYEDKQIVSNNLQNEVNNAENDIEKLISDTQILLRQNFSKMNSDSLNRLNSIFVDLSREQNARIAGVHQVNNEILPKIQSSWASVEKTIDDIRKKL